MDNTEQRHLVVAYHKDCIDGLASAWAVDRKYAEDQGVSIQYVGFSHHQPDLAEQEIRAAIKPGSEVLFLDVAPRPGFLKELLTSNAQSVEVIDHHKSAHDGLTDIKTPHLTLNIQVDHPSAAIMTWERMLGDKPRPAFLNMIGKMDVHTDLVTPQDFAIAAYIDSQSIRTIEEAFRSFEDLSRMAMNELALEGSGLYRDQYNRITKLGNNVMYAKLDFPGIKDAWIPVVNADVQNFGRSISQYLRELAEKSDADVAFAWYLKGNGKVTMSIRSDGRLDANAVAKHLCKLSGGEGGGHATSAAVHFNSIVDFLSCIRLVSLENTKAAPAAPKAHDCCH